MNKRKIVSFLIVLALSSVRLSAQEVDLFKEKDDIKVKDITTATFKSSRIVNGQSIENVGVGVLDLKILHRFGPMSQGSYDLFGLDQASMRIGLDYGVSKRLMVGIGRSTYLKQYDAFFKYKIIQQQTGLKNIPFSVSYAATIIYISLKDDPTAEYIPYTSDRYSYAHQILIASKLNDYLSLQFTPTLIHYNIVSNSAISNDFKSLGVGFRQRISKRVNFTTEYFYRIDKMDGYYDPLTVGLDIETGGHVFQLHVTNSTGMTERTFINETLGSWGKGELRFGFNLTRAFTLKKKKNLVTNKW